MFMFRANFSRNRDEFSKKPDPFDGLWHVKRYIFYKHSAEEKMDVQKHVSNYLLLLFEITHRKKAVNSSFFYTKSVYLQ